MTEVEKPVAVMDTKSTESDEISNNTEEQPTPTNNYQDDEYYDEEPIDDDKYDEDEEEDYEDGIGTGVTIAYAEPIEDERYYFRSFLPSKVGGKPAWLNPRNIPKPEELQCAQCQDPLKFLLQIYTKQFDQSYHRMIYIFICRKHECCGKKGTIKVFRSQLPEQNVFYDPKFYGNDESEINELKMQQKEDELLAKLTEYKSLRIEPYSSTPNCIVCGHYGQFKCSQCKNPLIYYCSKQHQKYHWYKQHKKYCKDLKKNESMKQLETCLKDYTFPTFEIVPDEEPLPDYEDVTAGIDGLKLGSNKNAHGVDTAKLIRQYKRAKKTEGDDGYNDEDLKLLEKQLAKDFDDKYLKFQERIHRAPAQIIRYADGEDNVDGDGDLDDDGNENKWSEPLWMGSQDVIDCEKDVPKCDNCGGMRRFEFQVMPQLLSILKQGIDDLDWGILAVFSCEKSCGDGNKKYFEEFVHYQSSYGAFEHRGDDGLIG